MAEELDYRLEASSQKAFAKGFEDDPNVAVPKVVAGSERVLVTEWMDGIPLSAIIADGTQQQRDLAGTHYIEFLLDAPAAAASCTPTRTQATSGCCSTGAWACSTSGPSSTSQAVCPMTWGDCSPSRSPLMPRRLWRGCARSASSATGSTSTRSGCWTTSSRSSTRCAPTSSTSAGLIRGVFEHINDPRKPNYSVGMRLNLPAEYLLIHRVWLGGIGVLCQLGATVPGRATVAAHIPGADLPPVG